jgi:hypothetical protein
VTEHPLDGAEAKIARAWEHSKTLRTEIRAFIKREPYRVAVDFDPKSGWHIAHLRAPEEPPLRLSIIAGEMAYEYISALNHVIWELAARKMGRKRVWNHRMSVQFPVTTSPEIFAKQALVRKRYISKPALAVVETLQPYSGPNGQAGAFSHPLWLTKEVADSDKHRILAPRITQLILKELEYDWDETAATDPDIERLISPGQILDDGTELGRVRFAVGNAEAKVRVSHGEIPVDILFGSGKWALSVRDFGNTHAYVNAALRRLAPLFPIRPA